jgi:hypothetical protein
MRLTRLLVVSVMVTRLLMTVRMPPLAPMLPPRVFLAFRMIVRLPLGMTLVGGLSILTVPPVPPAAIRPANPCIGLALHQIDFGA